jgi:hypothetical protein
MKSFTHRRGDTFKQCDFQVKRNGEPVNLTNVSIRMQLRKRQNGRTDFEFSTENGKMIKTTPLEGRFAIKKQVIDIEPFKYSYDIEFSFENGDVNTWLSGIFEITNDSSR